MIVTRFAPSPNGSLHLGHAYAALRAHDLALPSKRRFQLRIEDIDGDRSRPELAQEFRDDLDWLGLHYEEVAAQSTRLEHYRTAADSLRDMGVLYPCDCTRAQIKALSRKTGPDGPIYPGTCRDKQHEDVLGTDMECAWRLDVKRASAMVGPLHWRDMIFGPQVTTTGDLGDVVLVRKDAPASYHLAVTIDDASDGVTLVTRGWDLFEATHVHRLLQALLDLPVPRWHHHGLLVDDTGKKLAKSRGSASLKDRRLAGEDGEELARRLRRWDFPAGISIARP